MRRVGKFVLFVLFNIVVVAVLLELALRLAVGVLPPSLQTSARYVMFGEAYSEAWQPAWQRNRDYYWAMRPGLQDALQYGSPSVQFRLSTIELWDGSGIGFRTDPVDYFVDAIVAGDSFGLCFTERADCWVDRMADQLGIGIVNLSQPVTGTTSHERILRDYGAPMTPPLVIWQFFGNDFYDDYGLALSRDEVPRVASDEAAADAMVSAPDNSIGAWLRNHSVLAAVAETALTGRIVNLPDTERLYEKPYTVRYGADEQHTLQFGGLYERIALDMSTEASQVGYALSRDSFERAQAMVAGWGGQMVVLLVPTREEVYSDITADALGQVTLDALASARLAMLDLCDELDLLCHDATADLTAAAGRGEALYHQDDMHLNAAGNALLADSLARWLRDEGLDGGGG